MDGQGCGWQPEDEVRTYCGFCAVGVKIQDAGHLTMGAPRHGPTKLLQVILTK